MYNLRFYHPDDFDFWQTLHHEAYRPRVEPIWGWDADIQRGYAEKEILTPYSGQFIVQQNGQDVGYLSYTWEASGELYLSNIILIPTMRGQGLGGQIVRDLQAWAKRLGRTMYLRTFENNPAKKLYEDLGFAVYEHNTENHHYYLRWHG